MLKDLLEALKNGFSIVLLVDQKIQPEKMCYFLIKKLKLKLGFLKYQENLTFQ